MRDLRDLKAWQDLLDHQDLLENKDPRVRQEKQDLQGSLVDRVIRDQWDHPELRDPVDHRDCL
jgi:hypothetical protein